MAQWGNKDDKTSTGTVTLTAPTVTFNGATGHAAGVYTSASHPFQLGDEVVYSNGGGTTVVGLADGTSYFVTEVASGTFMVAATEAQALHNVPTPIVSTDGSGASHTFIRALASGRGTIAGSSTLFTTEASTGDIIQVGSQEMQIIAIATDTACTVHQNNQAALTVFSGQAYTLNEKPTSKLGGTYSSMNVVGIDGSEIAAGGDNITSVGVTNGGTLYVETPTVTVAAPASLTIPLVNVSVANDTITSTAHGLKTGTKLTYLKVGATAITGLVDATAYFVVADTVDTFKLASSLANAQAGTTIDLTGTGSAAQTFTGDTALATATITSGAVSSIAVTDVGSAYVTTPAVTVTKARLTIPTSGITTANTELVTYVAHGLSISDRIVYNNGGGSTATGLTNATDFFVASAGFTVDAFKVKAAATITTIAGVAITNTAGAFSCTATTLAVGDRVKITGTLGGTGTITSYTTGTVYKVSAKTGTSPNVTAFTLQTEADGAIVTTSGTPTGLTYTGETVIDISGTGNNAQYFEKYAATTATAEASRGTGPSAASKGWVNRVVMTGANAGRIQYETLVALSSAASMSDAADDLIAPDA